MSTKGRQHRSGVARALENPLFRQRKVPGKPKPIPSLEEGLEEWEEEQEEKEGDAR